LAARRGWRIGRSRAACAAGAVSMLAAGDARAAELVAAMPQEVRERAWP
jgi:hypothetical protein